MVSVVFDTNILIDCLMGYEAAEKCVRQHPDRVISVITQIEILAGSNPTTELGLRNFLAGFEVIHTSARIAESASQIRKQTGLKLPDALILASGACERRTVLTRDRQILNANHSVSVLCPYEV
jgi:predicted nucleic acid-binding protein